MRLIIIGHSQTVYYLARQFVRRKYHVTVISSDEQRSREIAEHTKATVILGDGTDIQRLEESGARQADVLLALTQHDQDNLIACQIAQEIFQIPRTIALVNDPDNEPIFQELGVSVAFSATRILGAILDQEAGFEDVMDLMPIAQGRVNITEVRIPEDSPALGKSLIDLELTEQSLIACIIRNNQMIIPRGNTELQANDHLILISQPANQEHDLKILCGVEDQD